MIKEKGGRGGSFYYEERRAETTRFCAYGTTNSVDTPRYLPLLAASFLRVHTRFMLLVLLPRSLSQWFFFFFPHCAARGRREKSRHRSVYGAYTFPRISGKPYRATPLSVFPFLHLFCIVSSTYRNLARVCDQWFSVSTYSE